MSVSTPARRLRVRRTTNGDADVGVQIARGLASRNFLPKRCLREQNFRGAPRRIPALGSDFGEYTLPTHGRYRLRWAEAYPTHPPTIEPILPHRARYPNPARTDTRPRRTSSPTVTVAREIRMQAEHGAFPANALSINH